MNVLLLTDTELNINNLIDFNPHKINISMCLCMTTEDIINDIYAIEFILLEQNYDACILFIGSYDTYLTYYETLNNIIKIHDYIKKMGIKTIFVCDISGNTTKKDIMKFFGYHRIQTGLNDNNKILWIDKLNKNTYINKRGEMVLGHNILFKLNDFCRIRIT